MKNNPLLLESFDDFIKLASTEITTKNPERTNDYKEFRKNKLIEQLGKENLEYILANTSFDEETLFESGILDYIGSALSGVGGDNLGNLLSGGLELGTKTILSTMIQPIIQKLNIAPQSFLWYFLSFGLSEAVTRLGKNILSASQPEFCTAFTKGATTGIKAYFSGMGYAKISQMLGFTTYGDIATNLLINMGASIKTEQIEKWVMGVVCNNKGNSIYDIVKSTLNPKDLLKIF